MSLFIAAPCPLLVAAENIDAVLDKAEQALGGHAVLDDLQAVRIDSHGTWAMSTQGIPPTPYQAEAVFRRPDQFRLTWKFPEELGGDFSFGYDGTQAWAVFGAPPARCQGWHRDMVLQMSAELQLFLVAPARAVHGDAFAMDATAADADPALVRVLYRPFPAGKPWSVWFAKDTGELVKLEHDSYEMDGQPVLARITRSEPKRFAGLNYPTRAKFESQRDGKVVETAEETIDTVELNPELPADFFACPKWEVDATAIGTKDVPAETVVTFELRGPYGEMSKSIDRLIEAVLATGLVPVGAVSGTYLNDPAAVAPQDLRTELAHGVAKLGEQQPVLPAGYVFTTRPAMRVAYAYHRGQYATEGEAHERLRAWMAQQGLQPAGPPRAIWFHDPEVTVADDLVTEVQIPVKQQTAARKKTAFNPLPLDHPWIRRIVGGWVGTGESNAGTGRGTVRFKLALNGQFLISKGQAEVTEVSPEQRQYLKTQLHASEEEIERFKNSPFRGLEIYTIDQETGEVVGYLFDSLRSMATGRGQWQGDTQTMNWQWSTGHKSTRITTLLGDDRLLMAERIAMPDGSTMEESGEMVRKR
jgi:effector-binding domain-containing protein